MTSNAAARRGPDAAARKLVELANAVESGQDGRIFVELINAPFLYKLKGTPTEYKAGLDHAIAKGWLHLQEPVPTLGSPTPERRCSPS